MANLDKGREQGAGQWKRDAPGPHLAHGLRTRRPPRYLLGEAAREIIDSLADAAPVRERDGGLPPHDEAAVESAALDLIIVRRALGYLMARGFEDERGRYRQQVVDGLSAANARLFAKLDRLGMTPAGRARLGLDLARAEREHRDAAAWMARRTAEEA